MSNSLGKEERLKGKKVVSEIFGKQKKSVNAYPFRAFYKIISSEESIAKFGIAVPKKKFKRAVDRNKIKRFVKEAVRINKSVLYKELDGRGISINVMLVCNTDSMPSFNIVEVKIKEILERLAQSVQAYEKK